MASLQYYSAALRCSTQRIRSMKLYYSPWRLLAGCPHQRCANWVRRSKPFRSTRLKHQLKDGTSYYDIRRAGYVPVLEFDNGARHSEAAALLQYVADQDPEQALIGRIGSERRLAVTEALLRQHRAAQGVQPLAVAQARPPIRPPSPCASSWRPGSRSSTSCLRSKSSSPAPTAWPMPTRSPSSTG